MFTAPTHRKNGVPHPRRAFALAPRVGSHKPNPTSLVSGLDRYVVASRKPALSGDRESDRSRMGTCGCISRPSPTTKNGVPQVPRIWGPGIARTHFFASSSRATEAQRRSQKPALSEDRETIGVEWGPAVAVRALHPPQKNGCPILPLFSAEGWDSTNLLGPRKLITNH
jgi:hypothetical protein